MCNKLLECLITDSQDFVGWLAFKKICLCKQCKNKEFTCITENQDPENNQTWQEVRSRFDKNKLLIENYLYLLACSAE